MVVLHCNFCNVYVDLKDWKGHSETTENVKKNPSKILIKGAFEDSQVNDIFNYFEKFGKISQKVSSKNIVVISFENTNVYSDVVHQAHTLFGQNIAIFWCLPDVDLPETHTTPTYEILALTEKLKNVSTFEEQRSIFFQQLDAYKVGFSKICEEIYNDFLSFSDKISVFGSSATGLEDFFSTFNIHVDAEQKQELLEFLRKSDRFLNVVETAKGLCVYTGQTKVLFSFDWRYLQTNKLIKYYVSLDEKIGPLIVLIKFWVHCNFSEKETVFSSYILSLMVIFYLQQEPYFLPCAEDLQVQRYTYESKDESDYSFVEKDFSSEALQKETLFNLLIGFFKFYSNFDYFYYLICPFTGRATQKLLFLKPPNVVIRFTKKHKMIQLNSSLNIQDPFNQSCNLLPDENYETCGKLVSMCRAALNLLKLGETDFLYNLFVHGWDRKKVPLSETEIFKDPICCLGEKDWRKGVISITLNILSSILLFDVQELPPMSIGHFKFLCRSRISVWHNRLITFKELYKSVADLSDINSDINVSSEMKSFKNTEEVEMFVDLIFREDPYRVIVRTRENINSTLETHNEHFIFLKLKQFVQRWESKALKITSEKYDIHDYHPNWCQREQTFHKQVLEYLNNLKFEKISFDKHKQTIYQDLLSALDPSFNKVTFIGLSATDIVFNNSLLEVHVSNNDNVDTGEGTEMIVEDLINRSVNFGDAYLNLKGEKYVDCVHVATNIKCRLYLNKLTVYTTELMKYYLSMDVKVEVLLALVRFRLEENALQKTEAFTGHCLPFLVIFYLQQGPYRFPSVADLQKNVPPEKVCDWNCAFDRNGVQSPLGSVSVFELLSGFCIFWAKFDYLRYVISPYYGSAIEKSNFLKPYCLPDCYNEFCNRNEDLSIDSAFCIQDPFEHTNNIAAGCLPKEISRFTHCCRHLYRLEFHWEDLYAALTELYQLPSPEFIYIRNTRNFERAGWKQLVCDCIERLLKELYGCERVVLNFLPDMKIDYECVGMREVWEYKSIAVKNVLETLPPNINDVDKEIAIAQLADKRKEVVWKVKSTYQYGGKGKFSLNVETDVTNEHFHHYFYSRLMMLVDGLEQNFTYGNNYKVGTMITLLNQIPEPQQNKSHPQKLNAVVIEDKTEGTTSKERISEKTDAVVQDHKNVVAEFNPEQSIDEQVALFMSQIKTYNTTLNRQNCIMYAVLQKLLNLKSDQIFIIGSSLTGIHSFDGVLDFCVDAGSQFVSPFGQRRLDEQFSDVVLHHLYEPFIQAKHKETKITCRLYPRKITVCRTEFVQYYLGLDKKVEVLMAIIQSWFKERKLKSPNMFSGYSLCLMVIFYLQQEPYKLPSVVDLQKSAVTAKFDEWNCGFVALKVTSEALQNTSIFELVKGFFKFYARFDYVRYVISPHYGSVIEKANLILPWHGSVFRMDSLLCIQDIFDITRNVLPRGILHSVSRFSFLCKEMFWLLLQLTVKPSLHTLFIYPDLNEKSFIIPNEKNLRNWRTLVEKSILQMLMLCGARVLEQKMSSDDTCSYYCTGVREIWNLKPSNEKLLLNKFPPGTSDIEREKARTSLVRLNNVKWTLTAIYSEQCNGNVRFLFEIGSIWGHWIHFFYTRLLMIMEAEEKNMYLLETFEQNQMAVDESEPVDNRMDIEENAEQKSGKSEENLGSSEAMPDVEQNKMGIEQMPENSVWQTKKSVEDQSKVGVDMEQNGTNIAKKTETNNQGSKPLENMAMDVTQNTQNVPATSSKKKKRRRGKADANDDNKVKQSFDATDNVTLESLRNVIIPNIPKTTLLEQLTLLNNHIYMPRYRYRRYSKMIKDNLMTTLQIPEGQNIQCFGSQPFRLKIRTRFSNIDFFIDTSIIRANLSHAEILSIWKNLLLGSPFFCDVSLVSKDGTSIIKSLHKTTGIECSLSLKNEQWLANEEILIFYFKDLKLKQLMLIVKYWALCHGLNKELYLPSYVLYILVIFYLQQKPYNVPSVVELQRNVAPEVINECNWVFNSIAFLNEALTRATLADLVIGFFQFYSNFDYISYVICPFTGTAIEKFCFIQPYKLPKAYRRLVEQPEHVFVVTESLCVQDFFQHSKNVTASVPRHIAGTFTALCRNTYQELTSELVAIHRIFTPNWDCDSFTLLMSEGKEEQGWRQSIKEHILKILSKIFGCKITGVNSVTTYYVKYDFVEPKNIWENRAHILKSLKNLPESCNRIEEDEAVTAHILKVFPGDVAWRSSLELKFLKDPTRVEVTIRGNGSQTHLCHFFYTRLITLLNDSPQNIDTATELQQTRRITFTDAYLPIVDNLKNTQTFSDQLSVLKNSQNEMEVNPDEIYTDLSSALSPIFTEFNLIGSCYIGNRLKGDNLDIYIENMRRNRESEAATLKLLEHLLSKSAHFKDVSIISKNLTSILVCSHVKTQLLIELNIRYRMSKHTSDLIKYYLSLDERFFLLAIFIKFWTICCKLKDESGFCGYTINLMIIFYLQQKYKLPSVVDLQKDVPPNLVEGWNCSFTCLDFTTTTILHNVTTLELVIGFFSFYSDFDYITYVVSPFVGFPVEKTSFLKPYSLPGSYMFLKGSNSEFKAACGFSVQDPFNHFNNVSSLVSLSSSGKFVSFCRNALNQMTSNTSGVLNDFLTFPNVSSYNFQIVKNDESKEQEWIQLVKINTFKILVDMLGCKVASLGNFKAFCVIYNCSLECDVWENRVAILKQKKEGNVISRETATTMHIKQINGSSCLKKFVVDMSFNKTPVSVNVEVKKGDVFHIGHFIYTRLRNILESEKRSKGVKKTIQAKVLPTTEKNVVEEKRLDLSSEKLFENSEDFILAMITSMYGGATFDKQMSIFLENIHLDHTEMEKVRNLIHKDLSAALSSQFPNHKVHFFGSNMINVAFKISSLDIFIDNIRSEKPTIELLKNLINKCEGFLDVKLTEENLVIECIHKETQMHCFLYVKNKLWVKTSEIINYYFSIDDRLRQVMAVIKFWFDCYDLKEAFSSYYLYLMVIFYLQQEPVKLPRVKDLQKNTSAEVIDGLNCAFTPVKNGCSVLNAVSVLDLITGFFQFYANFDYVSLVISPFFGSVIEKTLFLYQKFEVNCGIAIQDLFDLNKNVGSGITLESVGKFASLCRSSVQVLTSRSPKLTELLGTKSELGFEIKNCFKREPKAWGILVKRHVLKVMNNHLECKATERPKVRADCISYNCEIKRNIWDDFKKISSAENNKGEEVAPSPGKSLRFITELAVTKEFCKVVLKVNDEDEADLFYTAHFIYVKLSKYLNEKPASQGKNVEVANISMEQTTEGRIQSPNEVRNEEVDNISKEQTTELRIQSPKEDRNKEVPNVSTASRNEEESNGSKTETTEQQVQSLIEKIVATDNDKTVTTSNNDKIVDSSKTSKESIEHPSENFSERHIASVNKTDMTTSLGINKNVTSDTSTLSSETVVNYLLEINDDVTDTVVSIDEDEISPTTEEQDIIEIYSEMESDENLQKEEPDKDLKVIDMCIDQEDGEIVDENVEDEEDVPSDFFDDFSKEDFLDGLEICDEADSDKNSTKCSKSPSKKRSRSKSKARTRKRRRSRSRSPRRSRSRKRRRRRRRSSSISRSRSRSRIRSRSRSRIRSRSRSRIRSRSRSRIRSRSRSRSRIRSRSRSRTRNLHKKRKSFLEEICDKLNGIGTAPPPPVYNVAPYTMTVPPPNVSELPPVPGTTPPVMVNLSTVSEIPPPPATMPPMMVPPPPRTMPPMVVPPPSPSQYQYLNQSSQNVNFNLVVNESNSQPPEPVDNITQLFTEKKISLSDFLIITTQRKVISTSEQAEQKMKVISRCNDALRLLSEDFLFPTRFTVYPSKQNSNIKTTKYQSPLRKQPLVKFKFTSRTENAKYTDSFSRSLDRVLQNLGLLQSSDGTEDLIDSIANQLSNSPIINKETVAQILKASLLGMSCATCNCLKTKKTCVEVGSQCATQTESVGTQVREMDLTTITGLIKNDSIAHLTLFGRGDRDDRDRAGRRYQNRDRFYRK